MKIEKLIHYSKGFGISYQSLLEDMNISDSDAEKFNITAIRRTVEPASTIPVFIINIGFVLSGETHYLYEDEWLFFGIEEINERSEVMGISKVTQDEFKTEYATISTREI